jgi:hypothetical protein
MTLRGTAIPPLPAQERRNRIVRRSSDRSEGVKIRNMTQFLLDSGLMFKLNQTDLHPQGLSFIIDEKGELAMMDHRANPTIVFDPSTFLTGQAKYAKFRTSSVLPTLRLRKQLLGFQVQTKLKDELQTV